MMSLGRRFRAWLNGRMASLITTLVLSTFLFQLGAADHVTIVSSDIWLDGEQAMITFTSSENSSSAAHVSVNTSYTWAIHTNPVDYTLDPSVRCSVNYTGDNITQPLNFRQDATARTVAIAITELAFRSIAVYNGDGTVRACGTMLPTTQLLDIVALKAVFTSVVAGSVYLAEIGDDVFVFGKLFFTGNQSSASGLNLVVLESHVPFSDANVADCSAGGGVLHTLTSQLMVPNTPQPYAQGAFHISTSASTLNLETVTNLTLAVTNADDTVLSCAILQTLHDVGASYNSIYSPAITQRFPHYFATVIDNRIRSYDVLSDASSPEVCMDRSSVFNPWGGDPAVGELPETGVVRPNDIPGVPVIGSASIVAHKLNNSNCSFLKPASRELARVVNATVNFNAASVAGSIVMRQMIYKDGSFGPTFVSVDVFYSDGSAATTGHNWHVHQRRRKADGICSPEIVGDHYDPFLVKAEMNAGYDMECGPGAQLRCEMGDLAGKHGRMRIEGGGVSPRMTSVGYDVNLHLAGPYTVLGRSIVIHSHSDGSYLTCANIDPTILSETVVNVTFGQGDIEPNDLNFRIDLANTVANAAGVPLGNVLVYDVVQFNSSQQSCLSATLRFTGPRMDDADTYATAVSDVDTTDLGKYSSGMCSVVEPTTGSAGPAEIHALLVGFLCVAAMLFLQRQ